MFAKSLIAAATVAAGIALVPATQASAKTKVDVDIYFGGGGYDGGWGPGYGYYPAKHYGISCHKGKRIVRWAGFKHVQPIDCGAPVYQYKAWKFGNPYRVRVNMAGDIIKVKPL